MESDSAKSGREDGLNHKTGALYQRIQTIPKIELHAHLNGCVRETTLFDLAKERGVELSDHFFGKINSTTNKSKARTLRDCFQVFTEIGLCVTDLPALRRITREAMEDFSSHNVVYLELRTTPKVLWQSAASQIRATKRDYLETVLDEIKAYTAHDSNLTTRLIVSVDRALSTREAQENVDLAVLLSQQSASLVVGVDLGGDPTKNHFSMFREVFQQARDARLKITLHCAEIPDTEETAAMLLFHPDRLGHALFLSEQLQEQLFSLNIPVESCPTSNVLTMELIHKTDNESNLVHPLQQHERLKQWLSSTHPIAICTDDPGVFDTDATQELVLLAEAYNLTESDLSALVARSLDFAFCAEHVRQVIRRKFFALG